MAFSGDLTSKGWFFNFYKTAIELYLFGFTSFMILKRVFFYRIKGNIDVIRLIKKSAFQNQLLWQGIVLTLIYLVYNQVYFGTLEHPNTIMIGILILYYLIQIILNNNPSIYIDEQSFSYDDYFVDRWKWRNIKHIDLAQDKMLLKSSYRDFELDFDEVDQIDYVKLNAEVEQSILDGAFSTDNHSKTLVDIVQSYAHTNGVHVSQFSKPN
jgi:hypothetical protein